MSTGCGEDTAEGTTTNPDGASDSAGTPNVDYTGPISVTVKGDEAAGTDDREINRDTQSAARIDVEIPDEMGAETNVIVEIRDDENGYIKVETPASEADDGVIALNPDLSGLADGPIHLSTYTNTDGTRSEEQLGHAVKNTSDLSKPELATKLPSFVQDTTISIEGTATPGAKVTVHGGRVRTDVTVDTDGSFTTDVDLKDDQDNTLTVCVENEGDTTCAVPEDVAQVNPEEFIDATVTSTLLGPDEIEALVEQGIIDLDDPDNYNVTEFTICLGINTDRCYPTYEIWPHDGVDGSSEFTLPDIPTGTGDPCLGDCSAEVPDPEPKRAGVLIIEGRIKTLKEFFEVNLVLANSSSLYSLENITATIEFPEGVSLVASGANGALDPGAVQIEMADIPANADGTNHGSSLGQFILRGDAPGIYTIQVRFEGQITGPGLEEPIQYAPPALSDTITVMGPPPLRLDVDAPGSVTEAVPFDMDFTVTNLSEQVDVNYASMELDIGYGFYFTDPSIPCFTLEGELLPNAVDCCEGMQSASFPIGHLAPQAEWTQSVSLTSCISGNVESCSFTHDDNLQMFVSAGIECLDRTPQPPTPGSLSIGDIEFGSSSSQIVETDSAALFSGFDMILTMQVDGIDPNATFSLSNSDLIINNANTAIIPAEARSRLGEDTKNVLLGIAVPWDVLLEDVTLTILNPDGSSAATTLPVSLGLPTSKAHPGSFTGHVPIDAPSSATELCGPLWLDSDFCNVVGTTTMTFDVWGLRPDVKVFAGAPLVPVVSSPLPECTIVSGSEFCSHDALLEVQFPESLVSEAGTIPLEFRVSDGAGGFLTQSSSIILVAP